MSAGSPRQVPAQQVVVRVETYSNSREILRLLPAALVSAVFHAGLILLIWFFPSGAEAKKPGTEDVLSAEGPAFTPPPPKETFVLDDANPLSSFATDINYKGERKADVSVPGIHLPKEKIGIVGGDVKGLPISMPPPAGFGKIGQGGTTLTGPGGAPGIGAGGGYGPRGVPLAGSFYGRSGSTKEYALTSGGGTPATEAAVAAGLKWILRFQLSDGRWRLDHPKFKDPGLADRDAAATAFGLLPLLGAGKTHKAPVDDPQFLKDPELMKWEKAYSQAIFKGLMYLIRIQDKKDGKFHDNMYDHGLATIAMCEAYGLSQDPNIRKYAQRAVDYIIYAQHEGGGWRYGAKQAGDTSVVGWQVMALKSAQMAGLDVNEMAMKKATRFLESVCDKDNTEGYGYDRVGSSHTLTAVGLLCRQYIQTWGPRNPRMQKAVEIIKRHPPSVSDMYYTYYATQVMHHYGGQEWSEWNEKMRDSLLGGQDKSGGDMTGSWARGSGHVSGRLMQTSLCILTLEVYYRHLPLYYRATEEMAKD